MKKLVVAAVAAVVTASLNAPVASAQTRAYPDHDGGPGTAITGITVENAIHVLRVNSRHKSVLLEDTVWIDSRMGDPGPEYRINGLANSDALTFQRVESFKTQVGLPWDCPGARARSDNFAPKAISRVTIPQTCISGPGKVRVQTQSKNKNGYVDWAPNRGTYWQNFFTPWVYKG